MPSNASKPWLFQPGHDPRRQVGRPVGSKNGRPPLTPMRKLVRDAMSRAGNEQHKEGVLGFLTRVANAHPLEFFQEAVKLEPKLVSAELDENFNVNIQYQSPEEARAALADAGIILDAKPLRPVIAAAESHESISQESTPAAESPESPVRRR